MWSTSGMRPTPTMRRLRRRQRRPPCSRQLRSSTATGFVAPPAFPEAVFFEDMAGQCVRASCSSSSGHSGLEAAVQRRLPLCNAGGRLRCRGLGRRRNGRGRAGPGGGGGGSECSRAGRAAGGSRRQGGVPGRARWRAALASARRLRHAQKVRLLVPAACCWRGTAGLGDPHAPFRSFPFPPLRTGSCPSGDATTVDGSDRNTAPPLSSLIAAPLPQGAGALRRGDELLVGAGRAGQACAPIGDSDGGGAAGGRLGGVRRRPTARPRPCRLPRQVRAPQGQGAEHNASLDMVLNL